MQHIYTIYKGVCHAGCFKSNHAAARAGNSRAPAAGDPPLDTQAVTDPARVTAPNTGDTQAQSEAGRFLPNYESNYEMFLQLLRGAEGAMQAFESVFFSQAGQVVTSGLEGGIAEELAEFMQLIQMDEPQLMRFVKSQLEGA